jgi:hypothetical protein
MKWLKMLFCRHELIYGVEPNRLFTKCMHCPFESTGVVIGPSET